MRTLRVATLPVPTQAQEKREAFWEIHLFLDHPQLFSHRHRWAQPLVLNLHLPNSKAALSPRACTVSQRVRT